MNFLGYLQSVLFSRRMLACVMLLLLAAVIWLGGPSVSLDGWHPLAGVMQRLAMMGLLALACLMWWLRVGLGVVVIVALCLLVWFGGPRLAIDTYHPLAPRGARIVLIALLVLGYALVAGCMAWRKMRADADFRERLLKRFGLHDDAKDEAKGDAPTDGNTHPQTSLGSVHAVLDSTIRRALRWMSHLRYGRTRARWGRVAGLVHRLFAGREYRYDVPWYLLLGAPGAGKTSALMNAGFKFPVEEQTDAAATAYQAATHHCDWWLTDEAVLIDTAGRYMTHDAAAGAGEWHALLALLKKYRARMPLNAALLTISATDLLAPDPAARVAVAARLRARLAEARQTLKVRFPVYVVITKIDLLLGFPEYFESLTSEGRAQVLGFTLPFDARHGRDAETPAKHLCQKELARLQLSIEGIIAQRLDDEVDAFKRRLLYTLPQEFARLCPPLLEVLQVTFFDNKYDAMPLGDALRGVYFVSAAQGDLPLDADPNLLMERVLAVGGGQQGDEDHSENGPLPNDGAMQPVQASMPPVPGTPDVSPSLSGAGLANAGLLQRMSSGAAVPITPSGASTGNALVASTPAPPPKPPARPRRYRSRERRRQGYFLSHFFHNVLIPEANLVRLASSWLFRHRAAIVAGHALMVIAGLGVLSLLLSGPGDNRRYLDEFDARLRRITTQVEDVLTHAKPPAEIAAVLTSVHELGTTSGQARPSLIARLRGGTSDEDDIRRLSRTVYHQLQDRFLLPPVTRLLEMQLTDAVASGDVNRIHRALRAYLMLYQPDHFNAADVKAAVVQGAKGRPRADDDIGEILSDDAMQAHLDAMFDGSRPVRVAAAPNDVLVDEAREALESDVPAQRIYERIKAALATEAPPDFTLPRVAGPQAWSVFRFGSDDGLAQRVPGLFTRAGYFDLFEKRLAEFVGETRRDDDWVLGRSSDDKASLAAAGDAPASAAHAAVEQLSSRLPTASDPLQQEVRARYLNEYADTWQRFLADIRGARGNGLASNLHAMRMLSGPDSPLFKLARAIVHETTLSTDGVSPIAKQAAAGVWDRVKAHAGRGGQALDAARSLRASASLEKSLVDDRFAALREIVVGADGGSAREADASSPGLEHIAGLLNAYYTSLLAADTALATSGQPVRGEAGLKLRQAAASLPAPFHHVLSDLVVDGTEAVNRVTANTLQAQQRATLGDQCRRAVAGRYPFVRGGKDIDLNDFTRLFASGGIMDEFFRQNLAPYVDTSRRPWRYKSTGPDVPAVRGPNLAPYELAQDIRETFFRGQGDRKFGWKTDLRVIELDPAFNALTVDIDGQTQRYMHGPVRALDISWPGPHGGAIAQLSAQPADDATPSVVRAQGPWAPMRLIEQGRVRAAASQNQFAVEYLLDGRKIVLSLSSDSAFNPMNVRLLRRFRCPG